MSTSLLLYVDTKWNSKEVNMANGTADLNVVQKAYRGQLRKGKHSIFQNKML